MKMETVNGELKLRFGGDTINEKAPERPPQAHELKILPEYYSAVRSGKKRFEIRKNDRDFHCGDTLILNEWDGKAYTGKSIRAVVTYILFDWQAGLKDGYCIMSIDTSPANERSNV